MATTVALGGGAVDDDNDGGASHVIRPPPASFAPHANSRGVNRHSSSKTMTATTMTTTLLNYSTIRPDEHNDNYGVESCDIDMLVVGNE
jgi:hypothetical protein